MPSVDVLSVGGTVSVNAHGLDFRSGSLSSTIRSLRVMLADGTVRANVALECVRCLTTFEQGIETTFSEKYRQSHDVRSGMGIAASEMDDEIFADPNALLATVFRLGGKVTPVEGGYRLEWVRPVDMFPQTYHVECVTKLRLN